MAKIQPEAHGCGKYYTKLEGAEKELCSGMCWNLGCCQLPPMLEIILPFIIGILLKHFDSTLGCVLTKLL